MLSNLLFYIHQISYTILNVTPITYYISDEQGLEVVSEQSAFTPPIVYRLSIGVLLSILFVFSLNKIWENQKIKRKRSSKNNNKDIQNKDENTFKES